MNTIIWLLAGGVLGWLASSQMKTKDQQGIILNVVVGVTGAVIGGYFLVPKIGADTLNDGDFSVASLLAALVGAMILLAMVTMFRRESVRQ